MQLSQALRLAISADTHRILLVFLGCKGHLTEGNSCNGAIFILLPDYFYAWFETKLMLLFEDSNFCQCLFNSKVEITKLLGRVE